MIHHVKTRWVIHNQQQVSIRGGYTIGYYGRMFASGDTSIGKNFSMHGHIPRMQAFGFNSEYNSTESEIETES